MEFYKRRLNPKDFQQVFDTGQPEFPYLLDQKQSVRIFLTQTIEDIGYYESYKKRNLEDLLDLSDLNINFSNFGG